MKAQPRAMAAGTKKKSKKHITNQIQPAPGIFITKTSYEQEFSTG